MDKVQVLALVKLFNMHPFSVYVDWLEDNQLSRKDVNVKIADLLRNRMKQSKCCVLPVMEYERKFNGQEYLGLYPYLEYASFAGADTGCDFYICNQNRTKFIKLRDWVKGSTKYYKEHWYNEQKT